uniref:Uncharacterized protein AlNc14C8G1069 n=1 Tax=Albugo laibachii Nc14 TaxID=890382 RepID=F0W1Z0_9STRA|nr:conserved hypothetical protein [Albugo laibachii Nc14]|eukprot:CCA15069.1 conserved hypothetical protein [Albugo laibachii Nc14]
MNRPDTESLFKIKRILSIESSDVDTNNQPTSSREFDIGAVAVHTNVSKQYLAFSIGASSKHANSASTTSLEYPSCPLIVRSIEEDGKVRFWRFAFTKCFRNSIDRSMPLSKSPTRRSSFPTTSISASVTSQSEMPSIEKSKNAECLVALDFSPEGDWLAALSLIRNALYLIPIQSLIKKTRTHQLEKSLYASMHMDDSPNIRNTRNFAVDKGIMNLSPTVMSVQMSSYLRAKNEAGGCNGAKYRSKIANDDLLMSLLTISPDIGTLSCCRWWRSLNGKNYCLIGGTNNLISIVNIEENREECRCDLEPRQKNISTWIELIELLHESVNKRPQCSMLVKMRAVATHSLSDTCTAKENFVRYRNEFAAAPAYYYRVLLERQVFEPRTCDISGPSSALRIKTFQESYHEKLFSPQRMHNGRFRDVFSKQPLKDPATTLTCLYAINGKQYSEAWIAAYSASERKAMLYLNTAEDPESIYTFPPLIEKGNVVTNVEMLYSSTDLMLLQGSLDMTDSQDDAKQDRKNISVWVSLPSRQVGMEETIPQEARIVHHLCLHNNEKINAVLQTTSISKRYPKCEKLRDVSQGNERIEAAGQTIYIIWTDHNVYECYTQWSRLALFKALREQTIMLSDGLCIGYALGVDMASLCEVVADTLCDDDHLNDSTESEIATEREVTSRNAISDGKSRTTTKNPYNQREWIRELYTASRVQPYKAMKQLRGIGANLQAIAFGKQFSVHKTDNMTKWGDGVANLNGLQIEEQRRVAELLIDLLMEQNTKSILFSDNGLMDLCKQRTNHSEEKIEEEWLLNFLEQNIDYDFQAVIDISIHWQLVDLTLKAGLFRNELEYALDKLIQMGMTSSITTSTVENLLEKNPQVAKILTMPKYQIILRQLPNSVQLRIVLHDSDIVLEYRDWIVRNSLSFSVQQCVLILDNLSPPTAGLCPQHKPVDTLVDVENGECDKVTQEEKSEFYLTLLLRIVGEIEQPDHKYSQQILHQHIKTMKGSYRPSMILARCVDYQNWEAAAELFEAHGAWIDAVECRLRCHSTIAGNAKSDLTQIGPDDLLCLIQRLVQDSSSNSDIDEDMRESILSRILVKWLQFGFSICDLEVYILDEKNFRHLQPLLSSILYSEVYERVGNIRMGLESKRSSSNGQSTQRKWLAQCCEIPFSGRLLYRLSMTLVNSLRARAEHIPTKAKNLDEIVDVVRGSIRANDRRISAIEVPSHLSRVIGKSDPLETHVKVFSCGHLYPKRVFEEDILPEFEKQMNALPLPLFQTKMSLIEEWRRQSNRATWNKNKRQVSDCRSGMLMEAPCPLCCLNYFRMKIEEQDRQRFTMGDAMHTGTGRSDNAECSYYFIHTQENQHLSPNVDDPSNLAFEKKSKITEITNGLESK